MPASEGGRVRSRVHASVATLKTWWMAYLNRRIERVAVLQLEAMSDRELEDIGLTRSQIEWAVKGACARTNFASIANLQSRHSRGDDPPWLVNVYRVL